MSLPTCDSIRAYFQIIRFPGIFTVLSNVLMGFFITNGVENSLISLFFLLGSSSCLYFFGMILNDLRDYKIDLVERPNRPIPSGKISKKNALYLGLFFLVIANIFSLQVGIFSLFISVIISILIFFYNYKTKYFVIPGAINLSGIRFFNVILGTSLLGTFEKNSIEIALPIFILITGISILANKELVNTPLKFKVTNILLILSSAGFTILVFELENMSSLILIMIFLTNSFLPFLMFKKNIEKIISFQLFSIIILDSLIISLFSNVELSFLVLSLYIPAIIINRKIYLS